MHDDYYVVKIVGCSSTHCIIEYRNVIRMTLLANVLQYAMNDCMTTTKCHEIFSIDIRRWEALTADERKEVSYLEQQRKFSVALRGSHETKSK